MEAKMATLGEHHVATTMSAVKWSHSLYELGRYEKAEELYRRLLEATRTHLGPSNRWSLGFQMFLGQVLVDSGQVEEGLELLKGLLIYDHDSQTMASYVRRFGLCKYLLLVKKYDEAIELARDTITLSPGAFRFFNLHIRILLAMSLLEQSKLTTGEPCISLMQEATNILCDLIEECRHRWGSGCTLQEIYAAMLLAELMIRANFLMPRTLILVSGMLPLPPASDAAAARTAGSISQFGAEARADVGAACSEETCLSSRPPCQQLGRAVIKACNAELLRMGAGPKHFMSRLFGHLAE